MDITCGSKKLRHSELGLLKQHAPEFYFKVAIPEVSNSETPCKEFSQLVTPSTVGATETCMHKSSSKFTAHLKLS